MIGLAMCILAGFFILAAIFRKHIFNAILEAANTKAIDPSSPLKNTINMVRNLEIANTALDWMSWRKEKGDTDLDNLPTRKPSPDDNRHVDPGMFAEILDPEGPKVWEGQPPAGGTPKELPGDVPRKVDYEVIDPQGRGDAWEGQPPDGYPYKQLSPANETSDNKNTDVNTTEVVPVNNNTEAQPIYNPYTTIHAGGENEVVQVDSSQGNSPETIEFEPEHKITPETGNKREYEPEAKFKPETLGKPGVEPEIKLTPEAQTNPDVEAANPHMNFNPTENIGSKIEEINTIDI